MFDNHVVVKSDGTPHRTQVIVNDQDLSPYLSDISIHVNAGEMPKVNARMIPGSTMDITIKASVNIMIQALPGFDLIEESLDNGLTRYRTERR